MVRTAFIDASLFIQVSFLILKTRHSDKAAAITSTGHLLITNKRLAFLGGQKSLAIKLDKLLEIHPAIYGIKFSDGSKAGPKLVRYQNKNNGDIVCEVLNFVLGC